MPGDYTRFTYKAEKRYSAVFHQQGRPQLDADPNEQAEIFKRRWEIQAMDTFGRCVVPTSMQGNDSAFRITEPDVNVSEQELLFGPGRIYVEGLIAEAFADGSCSYQRQPFYPNPPAWPNLDGTRNLVAYLDVWEREVTCIQDPTLLEKALSGVDTTTRIQTVWQVKVMVGHCGTDLPLPSGGRFSTRAVETSTSDDPCILSPTGGYRGLENRLYRVVVHKVGNGDINAPDYFQELRIKWSRDNASVVSAVEGISGSDGTELTVSRLGRDKVLHFKVGDWVELLDDHRELREEPGALGKITEIDEANRRITVAWGTDSDPSGFDATVLTRHTRLIRWDQREDMEAKAGADGLVSGSSGWITLEDGVQIQLSVALNSEGFHPGDYCVFAARTADGSVEVLHEAPPRGVIHHYCHLAEFHTAGPVVSEVHDCRHFCSPCGGSGDDHRPDERPADLLERCCIVVEAGEGNAIQEAINSLDRENGGCICLKAGLHVISEPIRIRGRSNITLHSASRSARIRFAGNAEVGPSLLVIAERSYDITIDSISLDLRNASGLGSQGIRLDSCSKITVSGCHILGGRAVGVLMKGCTSVDINDTLIEDVENGIVSENSDGSAIVGNQISRATHGVLVSGGRGNHILNNRILDGYSGIVSDSERSESDDPFEDHLEVSANTIENMQGPGIDLNVINAGINHNRVAWCGHAPSQGQTGVGVLLYATEHLRLESCEILDTGVSKSSTTIREGAVFGLKITALSCQIETNRVAYSDNRMFGNLDSEASYRALQLEALDNMASSASILGNSFSGPGTEYLLKIGSSPENGFKKVIFSNNCCEHLNNPNTGRITSTILFSGSRAHLIVTGNHVEHSDSKIASMLFSSDDTRRVVVIGNITTGDILVGNPTPAQIQNFNNIVVS